MKFRYDVPAGIVTVGGTKTEMEEEESDTIAPPAGAGAPDSPTTPLALVPPVISFGPNPKLLSATTGAGITVSAPWPELPLYVTLTETFV